jgi:FAD/FMN-containing dehydrogenase
MLIDTLKEIVGPSGWKDDPDELAPHLTEWRDIWRGETLLLVAPASTAEVADVVAACRQASTAIVPQGGNTGLCGGAIPDADGSQVLLSLSRMRSTRNLDPDNHSMTVEAGCTLQSLQQVAADADRFFPLSLAAEGSCQIGGNLSTNAGGINVLRYGTARDQVLGLEVVLADGTIWNGLRTLRKDTAGYDLKHLFIGAEGTLGVITAAALKLYPKPRNPRTVLVAIDHPGQAISLLSRLRQATADQLQAFELIPDRAIRFVGRHTPVATFPLDLSNPWFVLFEVVNCRDEDIETELMGAAESGIIADAVVAKNDSEANSLWRIRHSMSEAQKREGASLKHDISVPVGAVAEFISSASAAVQRAWPGTRVVAFGHVGDGNIHFNLSQPPEQAPKTFLAQRESLATVVYDCVTELGGSISAEHGIGQARREHLRQYRSETELTLMATLKQALDPDGLFNPGKVI